jgi:hypothetical protein
MKGKIAAPNPPLEGSASVRPVPLNWDEAGCNGRGKVRLL